jgi:5,5'-dehydrodivanillate O-demethylase
MARATERTPAASVQDGVPSSAALAGRMPRKSGRAKREDFAHTGPGTLAGRYLRRFWQPVYTSAALPAGRAKPITIMNEQFTLYRGESGAAHVAGFRCPHRGAQLSVGWVRGDNIRCLYHGWTFAADGQCVEQPAEPEPFCAKIRIRSYPTQEYLGLIFAYLGEDEPPPLPRYLDFEEDGDLRAADLGIHDCNWFNRLDQAGDLVHVYFAHPQVGLPSPPGVRTEATEYGLVVYGDYADGSTEMTHFHMPNANQFQTHRDQVIVRNLHWRVPVDDDHYRTLGTSLAPASGSGTGEYHERQPWMNAPPPGQSVKELGDAILRGDLTIDEILHLPHAVAIEDYVITVGQGAIAPREMDHLGREDIAIILLRSLWARELRALSEERPLTQWTRPDRLPLWLGADGSRG